ncbi:MAG: AgmX/PglI C-terminal domain-containing protein [Nannocystaceae bacterium]|nr:AgmX/PglI C-terminal domain-containing protein [Nannocystaceae bacterium]
MSNPLSLKIFHNGRLVDHKTISQDVIKIGKLPSSHLCLEDDSVARMHAVIESSGNDVRIIDLGSAGGTFLNGQRVEKNASVTDGDALDFGPYRVEVELLHAAGLAAAGFGASMPVGAAGNHLTTPRTAGATALSPAAVVPQPVGRVTPGPVPSHTQLDPGEVETQDGTRVTEVIASYRGTVLDAQHVGQVKNRRRSASLFLGAAATLMLGGAAMLASEVGQDWEGYAAAKTAAFEDGATQPEVPGLGLGGLGLGLMLFGLIPMGLGVVRLSDHGLSTYRIGEAHNAAFSTGSAGLPSDTFALVDTGAGGHILNFTPSMTGAVTVGQESISLAELASSGHAAGNGSAYAYALPAGARCKLEHGEVTYFINEVAAGKRIAGKGEADKPFWVYNAASLAALGGLLIMTQLIPNESMAMDLDANEMTSCYVGYMTQPDIEEEVVEEEEVTEESEQAGGQGSKHAGDEGAMGDPKKKAANKMYASKGPKTAVPQMARNFDPDMQTRNAGILGQLQSESGHFLASPFGAAYNVGNDDDDLWGNMTGTEPGAAYGLMGLSGVGAGRGGGGSGEGTIGMGNVGLIGHGLGGGHGGGYGPGDGKGTGFKNRGRRIPRVRIAAVKSAAGIDKGIIRRIVRNHFREVVHCYNQGLVGNPNLKGRVAVQFGIGPTGKVTMSAVASNTTGDSNTGNCIAKAIKRWKFPKPSTGGTAIVTYPFVLNPG